MPDPNSPDILVVEEDETRRTNIAQMLRTAGFAVTEVPTGTEALRQAGRGSAVVVLDTRLSDVDGIEVCRKLKSDPATAAVPILQIACADSDEVKQQLARESPADACLTEVTEPGVVVAAVAALVRMYRAEEAEQAAARAWQATFDAITDAIFLLDRAGRLIRCNAALAALVGKPIGALVGRPAEDLHRALPAAAAPFTECLATRQRASRVMALGDRWFRLSTDPVIGSDREQAGAVGILTDITESRRVEAARRDSDEQFRALVESVRDYAIFRTDHSGHTTTWNEGVFRVLGFSEGEFVGIDARRLFPPEDVAAGVPEREMRQAADHGSACDDRWMLRRDGSRFFASGTMNAVHDENGNLLGFTKVMRDVTERKRSEEALKTADRRKDEFLAMLGHELRNPLAPIRNALFLMKLRGARDPGDVEQLHGMMDRQIAHISRLVDDLLDVSRIAHGTLELRAETIDLRDVVAHAADTIRSFVNEQQLTLDVSVPPDPILVDADPIRLEQVLANLLHNAAKYTEPGGRIVMDASQSDGGSQPGETPATAVVTVRDTGIGIPPELIGRVFDRFSRGDPVTGRLKEGLGLGLTLVKELVELHGGTVSAASAGVGKGSEFAVRLPRQKGRGPEARTHKMPVAAAQQAPQRTPKRILVVDDNKDAADSLGMVLEAHGDTVRVAYDERAGLFLAREFQPDVVLMDIGLPNGANGYELARRLRRLPGLEQVPIIALTGHARSVDHTRSAAAGFTAHLVKPVDPKELYRVLAQY